MKPIRLRYETREPEEIMLVDKRTMECFTFDPSGEPKFIGHVAVLPELSKNRNTQAQRILREMGWAEEQRKRRRA